MEQQLYQGEQKGGYHQAGSESPQAGILPPKWGYGGGERDGVVSEMYVPPAEMPAGTMVAEMPENAGYVARDLKSQRREESKFIMPRVRKPGALR
jgi:hypothetical protein